MSARDEKRSPLRSRLWDRVRRLLGKKPTPPPGDPYAYRMAPVRRGPKGRSGAAVAEPEDDSYRAYPPRRA
jgi:hypothetical protein